MRRLAVITAAFLCGLPACTHTPAATPPPEVAPVAEPEAEEDSTPATLETALAAIDQHFLEYQTTSHVPGMAWAIVKDGKVIHLGTSGVQDLETQTPVTADTLFRIASMSKAFTALAILKLRDEEKLSLDAPAETYVPELAGWTYPTADSPRITVRDLLSHTGGLVTDDPWGDRHQPMSEEDFTAMLRGGAPFSHAPQMEFEYSNYGYALLGRIITNVSGRPFNEYIRDEIMLPLGMTSTGYEVRDAPQERRALGYRWENDAWSLEPTMGHGVFGAMGGVQTSVNDYARWITFLLDAWPARDDPESGPVRRASVRELAQGLNFQRVSSRPGLEGDEPCDVASAYGKGLIAAQDCGLGLTLSHSGGYPGYGSNMLFLPQSGVGLFVFANRTYAAPSAANRLAALELLKAGETTPRAFPVSEPLAAAYKIAGDIYAAGNLGPGLDQLAMNFLMDRSPENWTRVLSDIHGQVGDCDTSSPVQATGALSGEFSWTCQTGTLSGRVLLAPTPEPGIQALNLRPAPNP